MASPSNPGRCRRFDLLAGCSHMQRTKVCQYTMRAKLGQGAYGIVYEGRDAQDGELVAIKAIDHPQTNDSTDQGLPLTVVREAAFLKKLRHENIVELKDVVLRYDKTYLVMRLYSCNLRQHIENVRETGVKAIDSVQLGSFMSQIISAVAYCHERNVLHRDLKPDNILLDSTRKVLKIADFGMARTYMRSKQLTERCVTAWYRAPEIILGCPKYGKPVDIWSVGCILAEIINLGPVFGCSTEFECLMLIFKFLGTPNEESWAGVTNLQHFQLTFPKWPPQPASAILRTSAFGHRAQYVPEVELLSNMLRLNPSSRISAAEALKTLDSLEPHTGYMQQQASSSISPNDENSSIHSVSSQNVIQVHQSEVNKLPNSQSTNEHIRRAPYNTSNDCDSTIITKKSRRDL